MRLVRAARRAAPRRRAPKLARTAVLVVALAVALPASSSARRSAPVQLGILPAGVGQIDATVEGGSALPTCTSQQVLDNFDKCYVSVEQGARVRLVATPTEADSPFLHWNRFDCEATGPCTVTVNDGDEVVVATFKKQELEVKVESDELNPVADGAVTSRDGKISCPKRCSAFYDAGAEIVLDAEGTHAWGKGCVPEGGDAAGRTCSVTMSNLRTFATVGFGVDPPGLPFDIRVTLRVQTRGSGRGRVTARGKDADGNDWAIDCGTSCTARQLQIQTRLTLQADPEGGSQFVRWLGVCSTEPVCRFSAGSKAVVGAVFEPVASPLPPPLPPSPAPPSPAPSTPPEFEANVTKMTVVGRTVLLRVALDRPAKATLHLVRGRAKLATRKYSLGAGRTELRFALPKRLAIGWYRIMGRFVSADGEAFPFDRPFRLRR